MYNSEEPDLFSQYFSSLRVEYPPEPENENLATPMLSKEDKELIRKILRTGVTAQNLYNVIIIQSGPFHNITIR